MWGKRPDNQRLNEYILPIRNLKKRRAKEKDKSEDGLTRVETAGLEESRLSRKKKVAGKARELLMGSAESVRYGRGTTDGLVGDAKERCVGLVTISLSMVSGWTAAETSLLGFGTEKLSR